MGFDKLLADLCGETVLVRSLLAFQSCPDVAEIRVVTAAEKNNDIYEAANRLSISKFIECVEGGAERHLSVSAGLDRVGDDCDLVAVHDGARPLVTAEAISRCAEVAEKTGALYEATVRNRLHLHNKLHSAHIYSLVPEDVLHLAS